MAELGRRETVNDPLAINGREQRPERSLALQGVRPPNNGDANALSVEHARVNNAMSGLMSAVDNVVQGKKDESITNGKIAWMSGLTEQEMLKNGDRYFQSGYKQLQARDSVNNWYTNEAINIENNAKNLDPQSYTDYLSRQRKSILDGIEDPDARRVAAAAFEDLSPRLAQNQVIANNKQNLINTQQAFASSLGSTSKVSATATNLRPGQFIPTTDQPVDAPIKMSATERDVAIKTVLGEAGGEGADGMAAVAHVMRNRLASGKWGSTIESVAKAPSQFSTWNQGDVARRGMVPGNPLYDKAASIVDAVMGGVTVDQTGGATHYYAPTLFKAQTGNDKPDWWDGESKGKTEIRLGGHVFLGKAGVAASATGELVFDHKDQEAGIQPALRDVLSSTAAVMGGKLKITSGYRSPEYNASVGGAKQSEHMHGNAADIDMSGMDNTQRAQLVRELQTRGAKGFITYSNQPNMLHVDLKDRGPGGGFMFNKSKDNMSGAPDWFKQVSQEQPGQVASQAGMSGTEIQGFIRGYGALPNNLKATAVADEMRRQLDADNPKLFNDAGGVSILHELGAQPGEIDEVLKAKERYDKKQFNKFDTNKELFDNDILTQAQKGVPLPKLLEQIDAHVKSGQMDDAQARALAGTAADKVRAFDNSEEKKSKFTNVDFMAEIGGLYQQISAGHMDFTEAGNKAKQVAAKYGATDNDVRAILSTMQSTEQGRLNTLRQKAEEEAKKYNTNQQKISEVDRARARGTGLDLVKGDIEVRDPSGQVHKMDAQEYGAQVIKDHWSQVYGSAVKQGTLTQGEAKVQMLRQTYLELQKQGIVDKQTSDEIRGSLTGNIIDNKTNRLRPEAAQAYESWLILKDTPGVTDAYLAKTVPDDNTRTLLEQAYRLRTGNLSDEQALIKAHEQLNNPLKPEEKLAKDAIYLSKRDDLLNKAVKEATVPGFFERFYKQVVPSDIEQALKNTAVAKRYIDMQADMYNSINPQADPEVHMKKAVQDFQNNAAVVAGNIIVTKPGQELHKVMGMKDYGATAVNDAVREYVTEHADTLWPKGFYSKTVGDNMFQVAHSTGDPLSMSNQPPLIVTYDPSLQILSVDTYKDYGKGIATGMPAHIRVQDIGASYVNKRNQPTWFDKAWNSMFEGVAAVRTDFQQRKKEMDANSNASAIGAAIGGMAVSNK